MTASTKRLRASSEPEGARAARAKERSASAARRERAERICKAGLEGNCGELGGCWGWVCWWWWKEEEKVEEFEKVEEGVTGPRVRRDWAKVGSEASRLIAGRLYFFFSYFFWFSCDLM